MTPFKVVYGREPPSLLPFEKGSTRNFELEQELLERDEMLHSLKLTLARAQQLMKDQADKHRRDVQFAVGDMEYLKLRPYRQQSVVQRFCQKFAAKFYGPYRVVERIGNAAYKLLLPSHSRIHPVFHVSQLKIALNPQEQVLDLPRVCLGGYQEDWLPSDVIDKRYDSGGRLELLVTWRGKPAEENSWMSYLHFIEQFPSYKLEGKLGFVGGSIDRYKVAYYRRRKGKEIAEEDDVENTVEDSNEGGSGASV